MDTTADLAAYVLELRPLQPITLENHMGRASQELALRLMGEHDPALATALHDSSDLKPFTASGLLRADSLRVAFGAPNPSDRVWLRLTALQRELIVSLDQFAARPPAQVEYDNRRWAVESVITDAARHPWAWRARYADLLAEDKHAQGSNKIALEFVTPTSFRSKGLDVPLPMPWLVFHSLSERWQTCSPIPLPERVLDFVDQFLALTRYRLETAMIGGKNASKRTGFVGQATFTIMSDNPSLKAHDPGLHAALQAEREVVLRAIMTLARFAFFSGVGRQTTTGMGMCALLSSD